MIHYHGRKIVLDYLLTNHDSERQLLAKDELHLVHYSQYSNVYDIIFHINCYLKQEIKPFQMRKYNQIDR